MKQQLHLPFFLLTGAIIIGSLTTTRAQKVPVRKPAARTATAKPAAPQVEPIPDMLKLSTLEDLPSINDYLTSRNWRFSKSQPGEQEDEITYRHSNSNGARNTFLHIFFCNKADNKFCNKPQIHEGQQSQHFYFGLEAVEKSLYDSQKAILKTLLDVSGSMTGENSITTVSQGDGYKFMFTVNNSGTETVHIISYKKIVEGDTPDSKITD